jgi:hypothetical protein
MPDAQLLNLEEAERHALDLFMRLSEAAGMGIHSEAVQTAQDLWNEAAAAVLAYILT